MMDIQEMLERAAKAAGYELKKRDDGRLIIKGTQTFWRPDECDAQAFRLMVDCGIDVEYNEMREMVTTAKHDELDIFNKYYADHNGDKHAATRMAILRAAAGG